MVASLQTCETLTGINFCDKVEKVEKVENKKLTVGNGDESELKKALLSVDAATTLTSIPHEGTTTAVNSNSIQVQIPPPNPSTTPSKKKEDWSEFGIPPSPSSPPPPPPATSGALIPGPVVAPLALPSCECDCCQLEVDPCQQCPDTSSPSQPLAPAIDTPINTPIDTPMPPLAREPDTCDPCDPAIEAELIFRLTGVDSSVVLTNDVKQSIVHLFSAMLVVDDSHIMLTDLGNMQFQSSPLSQLDPLPTPPMPEGVVPPEDVVTVEPITPVVMPEVLGAPVQAEAVVPTEIDGDSIEEKKEEEKKERRRRRLLMGDKNNIDLDQTLPAQSAIPIPIVAAPLPTKVVEKGEEESVGLTIRLVVACSSDNQREEVIARYTDVCLTKGKLISALKLVLPTIETTTCPQVVAGTKGKKKAVVLAEETPLEEDNSNPLTVGSTMSETDIMEDEEEPSVLKNGTIKGTKNGTKNGTKREPMGPVITGGSHGSETGSEGGGGGPNVAPKATPPVGVMSKETNETNETSTARAVLKELSSSIQAMKRDIDQRKLLASVMLGEKRERAMEEIRTATRRLKLSEDDVRELKDEIQEEKSDEDQTGAAAATGGGDETGSATGGGSSTGGEEEEKEEEDDEVDAANASGEEEEGEEGEEEKEEEEKDKKDVQKEEREIQKATKVLKEEEKEEKKEEAEATQKFKTKVPTTLLRGSLNHGDDDDVGVPRRQYSILSGDEGAASMVSLDAVARDLEKQGFHSTLMPSDSDR